MPFTAKLCHQTLIALYHVSRIRNRHEPARAYPTVELRRPHFKPQSIGWPHDEQDFGRKTGAIACNVAIVPRLAGQMGALPA